MSRRGEGCGFMVTDMLKFQGMNETEGSRYAGLRVTAAEFNRMTAAAAERGVSRSKLIRAGFVLLEATDEDTISTTIASLPADRRGGWTPATPRKRPPA